MLASSAGALVTLLGALGLGPALLKPFPQLTGALDPLLAPLSGLIDPLASALGPVGSIIGPLTGILSPVTSVLGPPIDPLAAPLASLLSPLAGLLGGGGSSKTVGIGNDHASSELLATQGGGQVSPSSQASCIVSPYNVSVPTAPSFDPFDQIQATLYRYREQKAVNLGAWFVLERWMVPSLFTCAAGDKAAEIDVASGWGSVDDARQVLERHWDTFITEDDFKYLSSIGINTVRLPIGYWSLGPKFCQGTPFEDFSSAYQGSWPRVLRAIEWANNHGIGVLVDLHGAPGSQNGQQHSGVSDGEINLFNNATNIAQTVEVLKFLTSALSPISNCVGIELLNEPQNDPSLPQFYNTTIDQLRDLSKSAEPFPFYVHDAFALNQYADFLENRTDFVVLDHHSYFVYTAPDSAESVMQHTTDIDTGIQAMLQNTSSELRRNFVIDEWSCALTSESLSQEKDADAARSNFCQTQMDVYGNVTAGWSFWSYLKEECTNDVGWCFKSAVGKVLPHTFFSYPGSSNSSASSADVANVTLPSHDQFLALAMTPPSRRSFEESTVAGYTLHHRWSSIYGRRSASNAPNSTAGSLYAAPISQAESQDNLAIIQSVVSKGYSDGFLTAQRFAEQDSSKLGFAGQYVKDSLLALGPTVVPAGNEEFYRQWFWQGLKDGEATMTNVLSGSS